MNQKTKQIIVIPGIMGSKLKQGLLRIWPSYVGHANFKTIFGKRLKYKEDDKTKADKLLKLTYGKLINSLNQNDAYVDEFSYDWRKNNLDQLSLLENMIRIDVEEIYIVAHSMGGIVAKLFLNHYKDSDKVGKIRKLITLGTPWHGSPKAYKMIHYGVEDLKDWQLLLMMSKENSKDIITTFPSVYQLLPDSIYLSKCLSENKPYFLEENGEKLSWHDIYNHKYVPLIENHGLNREEIFQQYYSLKNEIINVEHHEIIGYGYGTLYSFIKNPPNETECEFNTGDATVPICSANSNAPFQYFIKETHQNLVQNNVALSIIKSIINNQQVDNDDDIEYDYNKASQYKFTGKVFKVACPVIVSLIDDEDNIIYGNIDFDENPKISLLDDSEYNIVQIDNIVYLLLEENSLSLKSQNSKTKSLNKLFIEAYDEGPVSISIEEFNEGKITKVAAFNSFNINSDISVELSVDTDIDNSKMLINEYGKKSELRKAVTTIVVDNNEKIMLPQTKFELLGDKAVFLDDGTVIFTANKLKLRINEVIQGTNPVLDTRYILNDKKSGIITPEESIELEFESKVNILKVYSVDSRGNAEKESMRKIYFLVDEKPNVEINFYSTYYSINVEDAYNDILESHNIELPKPIIKLNRVDGENTHEQNNFEYTNIINSIKIQYCNLYKTDYEFDILIHENEAIAILQGENNPQILIDFLYKIGMKEPYDTRALHKYQGRGTLKTISAENIYNSKIINISKDNFNIFIYKEFRNIVSFQSLMEDIKLNEENIYKFEFKVIDTVTAKEISNLDLRGYIEIILDNSPRNMYDINIQYDKETSNYIGIIDIPILRFTLTETTYSQERENGIKNASLIIEQVSEINTKIRVHPITIR